MKLTVKSFIYSIILLSSSLLIANTAKAQRSDKLDGPEIVIPTSPVLSEGRKIEIQPQLTRDEKTPDLNFSYSTLDKFSKTDKHIHPLSPVAHIPERPEILPNLLVKAGYGNLNAKSGDFIISNNSDQNLAYGLRAHHYSTDVPKSIKDYSRNEIGAFSKIFRNKQEFGVNVDYSRDALRFFNLPDSISEAPDFDKKDVVRAMENWQIRTYYKSGNINYVKKYPYYKVDLGFDRFNLTGNQFENSFQIGGVLKLEHDSYIKDGDRQPLEINANVNIDNLHLGTINSLNRIFIWTNAREHLSLDILNTTLKAELGLNLDIFADSLQPAAFVTPYLNANLPLIKDRVDLYAGVDGGHEKQGLKTLFSFNPFIQDNPLLKNKNTKLKAFLGFDVNVAPKTVLKIEAGNKQIEDMPLFVGTDDPYRRFAVIYDNVNHTYVEGQMNFNLGDKMWVNLQAQYNNYKMSSESHPWLYPDFEGRAKFNYNISKNFNVNLDFITLGNRTALDENNDEISLKPLFDLNLGSDFRFKNGFIIFLELNNVTSSKYQRWYQYPVYGFNAIGGLGYRF